MSLFTSRIGGTTQRQLGVARNYSSSPIVEAPKKSSFIQKVGSAALRALNVGVNASAGAAREIFRNSRTAVDKLSKGDLSGIGNITTNILPVNAIVGAAKGIAEDYSYSKAVESNTFKQGIAQLPSSAQQIINFAKPGIGLAADIFLDPTTYVGIGAATKLGKAAKSVTGLKTALKAGEVTKSFADKGIRAALKEVPVGTKTTSEALKLGGTSAERAAKGQQALVSFLGAPVIKGTGVFKAIENIGSVFKSTKVGQALEKAFVSMPGVPEEVRKMFNNKAAAIFQKQQGIIKTVKELTKDFTNKEIINGVNIIDAGGKLPAKFKPIRKQLDELARVEKEAGVLKQVISDYVPYMAKESKKLGFDRKQVSTKLTSSMRRKNTTFAQYSEALKAQGLTPETNLQKVLARRMMSSVRALENKSFLEDMKRFGYSAKDALPGMEESSFAELKGILFPKEIKEAMEGFNKQYFNDESMGAFIKAYDTVLNTWKGLATASNLGFHVRNLISNQWQLFIGGVNPLMLPIRSKQAIQVMLEKGSVLGMSAKEIKSLAKSKGVIKGDMALADLTRAFETDLQGNLRYLNPIESGRKLGGLVEDNSRVALFVDALSKGMSPDDAAMHVKKFLFDYSELTPFEKNVMKRIIPFYSWMRKNIPLQIENMIKQPGKYNAVQKITSEYNKDNENLPDWAKKLGPLKLPGATDLFYNPNMPFQDISKLQDTLSFQGIASSLSPLLKIPAELAFGKNVFNGSEIKDLGMYFAQQIPAASQIAKQIDPNKSDEDKAYQLLGYLAGIKIMKIKSEGDKPKYEVEVTGQLKDKIYNDINKARVPSKPYEKTPVKPFKYVPKPPKVSQSSGKKVKKPIQMAVPRPARLPGR